MFGFYPPNRVIKKMPIGPSRINREMVTAMMTPRISIMTTVGGRGKERNVRQHLIRNQRVKPKTNDPKVIRGLALGTLNERTRNQFLTREFKMALALSSILSIAGFTRAIFFRTPFPEALAVTCALGMIVFSSICLGAILPILLEWIGVDPAHSSTKKKKERVYGKYSMRCC